MTTCFKRGSKSKGTANETCQTKIENTFICHFQLFPWHPVMRADTPSKNYSSRQPDKELTAESHLLSSLKQRPNTFSVPLFYLINPAGRKFSGGEEHVRPGSPREGRDDGVCSHRSHSAGNMPRALRLPACSLAAAEENLSQTATIFSTMVLFREAMPSQQISPIQQLQRSFLIEQNIKNITASFPFSQCVWWSLWLTSVLHSSWEYLIFG